MPYSAGFESDINAVFIEDNDLAGFKEDLPFIETIESYHP